MVCTDALHPNRTGFELAGGRASEGERSGSSLWAAGCWWWNLTRVAAVDAPIELMSETVAEYDGRKSGLRIRPGRPRWDRCRCR